MTIQQRIEAFIELKNIISSNILVPTPLFEDVMKRAEAQNPWFTKQNILLAFESICDMLEPHNLYAWIEKYTFQKNNTKTVALILAGNIPVVGFHDVLCVLMSGHRLRVKLSSKDTVLMTYILQTLQAIEPEFTNKIYLEPHIVKDFDAIIATGSTNSSRYFEYYFTKYPHIIRKSRNSIAVITESDTIEQYTAIGNDIFNYFGLGCRNVSKLYVPHNFKVEMFFEAIEQFNYVATHTKYMNNYEYNKSIYLVGNQSHYDNGFVLLKEDNAISSPLAVVYFEKYMNFAHVQKYVETIQDTIQCIVSTRNDFYKKNVLPGCSQRPAVWEYADDIDTMEFLLQI
jgi:hypothetical protein